MKKDYQKVPIHQKAKDFENIGLFSQKDYEERRFPRNL